ncbi:MAG: biosynthetic-type acetolactate synthase large subunit [Salinivirgaceae bacterium]|jgi:acetolactate synthase-1/2/3 large subunit|nr:biosynthetic-type acetolactate synthase large subunit [Salinivirgaceae bacterium]
MGTQTIEEKKVAQTETVNVTGSDALLLSLITEGASTIFGYPGGAIMPLYDKLMDYKDKLKHILTRHEQGAIHAAQGFARVTGKPGVCFATSGPGATNLITGIADAYMDSTPLVCITGQVFSALLGTDGFQETDVVGVTMPVTKWNYQVTKAEEIPEAIAKAFYIACSGRPGPVVIDVTKDAMMNKCDYSYKRCKYIRSYIPEPRVNNVQIEAAAKLINEAKKPLAVVGQGVILGNAEKELLDFVNKSGVAVATTLLGLSAIPNNHAQYTGTVGMHGNAGPNIKTNDCDLLIAIGMRFDDRVTGVVAKYAPQAKKIHFEIDKAEINKIIQVDAPVLGNVGETLAQILDYIQPKQYPEWLAEFKACDKVEYDRVIKEELHPADGKINMGEVIEVLNDSAKGDAIICTDVGQHQMFAMRYCNFNSTRTWVTSGGLGTMGFGLPAAMGAQFGCPDKKVVSISGDGGFQMTMQELGTIAYNKLPVKMIVLNNNFLGMVRQWQELFFEERYSNTPISSPDFVALAASYKIEGETVLDRSTLKDAIERMYNSEGAYILEIKVTAKGNVFPMVPAGASVSDILYGDENKK